jgi:hypothetical protein
MIPRIKDAKDFESYVSFVYDILLNSTGDGIQLSQRSKIKGRSGSWYEIDVYYEFVKGDVTHRVAFECKYWNKNVDRDAVLAFHSKLSDIGNIHGVMVTKTGFQQGTRDYARHYGIELRHLSDLPTFFEVVATRLKSVAMHDPRKRGEPFWVLMEEETASYWTDTRGDVRFISLFISKVDAESFLARIPDPKGWVVSGLPLSSLRFLVEVALMQKAMQFMVVWLPSDNNTLFSGYLQSPQEIQQRFIDPLRRTV